MTPAEYQSILLDLLDRKIITPDEAADLMYRFLAGDINDQSLPLPPQQAAQRDDAWLLLFLGFSPTPRRNRPALDKRTAKLSLVRQQFEERSTLEARQLASGSKSVRQWHAERMATIGGAMLAAWQVGQGTATRQPDIDEQIDDQLAFLFRFASENHALTAVGRPPSEESLINRSILYWGAVRGAFFRGNEAIDESGLVSRYIANDDRRTCSPCRNAAGYYRLGEGPMPGEVCLGGYACRCVRIVEYNPEMAATLI